MVASPAITKLQRCSADTVAHESALHDNCARRNRRIFTHIAKVNPLAADEVSALIDAMIARIADYPRLAVETDVPVVHVVSLLPYKYLVFYNVQQGAVIIRNLQHAARSRLYWRCTLNDLMSASARKRPKCCVAAK